MFSILMFFFRHKLINPGPMCWIILNAICRQASMRLSTLKSTGLEQLKLMNDNA